MRSQHPQLLRAISYYLQYIIIRFFAFFLEVLPISFGMWLGKRVGDLTFFFMARRRKIALDNVQTAFGDTLSKAEKRIIARSAFQSITISLIELFTVKRIKANVNDHITVFGKEHIEQALAKGKGVVFAVSHLGSWEYLCLIPFITGNDFTVVVKKARNPFLNNYINYLRRVMTIEPVDKENAVRPMLKELRKNHVVAILIDQWAGDEGLWVDFFNTKTSTTSVPAKLATRTGCAIIPGYCLRKSSGKYEIHIYPAVPLDQKDEGGEKRTTEKLNKLLEEKIREYPNQWLWGHRRWKKKPS